MPQIPFCPGITTLPRWNGRNERASEEIREAPWKHTGPFLSCLHESDLSRLCGTGNPAQLILCLLRGTLPSRHKRWADYTHLSCIQWSIKRSLLMEKYSLWEGGVCWGGEGETTSDLQAQCGIVCGDTAATQHKLSSWRIHQVSSFLEFHVVARWVGAASGAPTARSHSCHSQAGMSVLVFV